jgi:hypothetical protein
MNVPWQRTAGVAGLVFAILATIAGLVLAPQPPMSNASVSTIVHYYADHRTGILIQGYVFGLSWVAFLVFAGGLWRALRASDMWASAALIAAGVWLALNMVSQSTISGISDRVAGSFPIPATIIGMHSQIVMYFGFSFFALAALVGAAVTGALQTGIWSRWLCWFGYLVAALALVAALSLAVPSNGALFALLVIAYLLFTIWVIWASIELLRTRAIAE